MVQLTIGEETSEETKQVEEGLLERTEERWTAAPSSAVAPLFMAFWEFLHHVNSV